MFLSVRECSAPSASRDLCKVGFNGPREGGIWDEEGSESVWVYGEGRILFFCKIQLRGSLFPSVDHETLNLIF